MKTPITIAPEALDFTPWFARARQVGWAEATAEPVFLTRMLDAHAERCPPFCVFFVLTFSEAFAAGPSRHWEPKSSAMSTARPKPTAVAR